MTGQRGALLVSVAPVLRRAGVQHPLQRCIELEDLSVADSVIAGGSPIELDLLLEATGNAVVCAGEISAVARCSCRRCLEPFDEPVSVRVREIFDPSPVEGETYPLRSEHIDVVPFVRDALLLALPLAPLCRPDCEGPAPELFPTRTEQDVDRADESDGSHRQQATGAATMEPDHAPARDPRWAALDQLQLDR